MLTNKLFQNFWQAAKVPTAGLLLSLGFATSSSTPILASGLEAQTPVRAAVAINKVSTPDTATATAATKKEMRNGVYVFGQSSQPEQLGQEYLVFESRRGKVVGAFYMPSSEFSCFYGNVNNGQMNLTVIDPYEETKYSHSIALESNTLVASNNQIGLQGYQPVTRVSDNDQRLLRACQQSYQQAENE